MRRHTVPLFTAAVLAVLVVPGSVLLAGPAWAATSSAPPKAAASGSGGAQVESFCSQVRRSQTAIATLSGTTAAKNRRIGLEWTKIETVSPANIKSEVALIKAAYTAAATQTDAKAKATVAGISGPGQKVTSFVSANCGAPGAGGSGGPGGRGGPEGEGPGRMDAARRAEVEACFKKEGFTVGGEARPNFDDPKFQAAAQKCGFGGPGGPGDTGRRAMSEAMRKCILDKGVTLPTRPAGGAGGSGAGAGGAGRPGGFDEKTRAAIEACRSANP